MHTLIAVRTSFCQTITAITSGSGAHEHCHGGAWERTDEKR